jgi:hypothetical protein
MYLGPVIPSTDGLQMLSHAAEAVSALLGFATPSKKDQIVATITQKPTDLVNDIVNLL